MNVLMQRRVLIVLQALLTGMKIKLGDHQYQMDSDLRICQLAWDSHKTEYLLPVGHSDIATLVHLTETATIDQIILIANNLGINEK